MYRFSLHFSNQSFIVTPAYNEGDLFTNEREPNQIFLRKKLAQNLTFVRNDADLILATDLETRFELRIHETINDRNVNLENYYWRGYFYRIDCKPTRTGPGGKIRTIEVKPLVIDQYTQILEKLEFEYDLVTELQSEFEKLTYSKQGLLQIWQFGTGKINNYVNGGIFYQTDIDETNLTIGQVPIFGFKDNGFTAYVTGINENLTVDCSGRYFPNFVNVGGIQQITFFFSERFNGRYVIPNIPVDSDGNFRVIIQDTQDNDRIVYESANGRTPTPHVQADILQGVDDVNDQVRYYAFSFYSRILTDQEIIQGVNTDDYREDDPFGESTYKKTYPVELKPLIVSEVFSENGGQYGKFPEIATHHPDQYFATPVFSGGSLYPINESDWLDVATFFVFDSDLRTLQNEAAANIELQHAYTLENVLKAFFRKIDASIIFENTFAYSEFLYTQNDIRGEIKTIAFTPKQNIKVSRYDTPVKIAKLRLKDVDDFLKNFYKAYWYIDQNKQFHIEHLSFFENGLSYEGFQNVLNLENGVEPKTGRSWVEGADGWDYEKERTAARLEFAWMDEVSEAFAATPITHLGGLVDQGKKDEINFSIFTSDIDYILLNTSAIADQGFCFFECERDNFDQLYLPLVELGVDGETVFKVQNGYASLVYALPKYYIYDSNTSLLIINEVTVNAATRKKIKFHTIDFSNKGDLVDFAPIKTFLGTGVVESYSEGAKDFKSNRSIKAKVLYNE